MVRIHQPGPLTITEEEAAGVDVVPGTQPRLAGERLAGSYVNSYIGNGIVVLPMFDDPHDAAAVATYEQLFPGPPDLHGARPRDPPRRRQCPLHHPAAAERTPGLTA